MPSSCSANETNPIAEEGTLLHEACETRKLDGLSHEQQQLVALCLNYVDTLREESTKVYLERKLQIHLLGPDEKHLASIIHFPNIFGTGDVIMCHEERNHIDLVDYKFGYGEIDDAEDNIQGQATWGV